MANYGVWTSPSKKPEIGKYVKIKHNPNLYKISSIDRYYIYVEKTKNDLLKEFEKKLLEFYNIKNSDSTRVYHRITIEPTIILMKNQENKNWEVVPEGSLTEVLYG